MYDGNALQQENLYRFGGRRVGSSISLALDHRTIRPRYEKIDRPHGELIDFDAVLANLHLCNEMGIKPVISRRSEWI